MDDEEECYYIGVDVGTGSVRAGLYTAAGRLVSRSTREIKTWGSPDLPDGYKEQSTSDIWRAVQRTVKVHDVIEAVACIRATVHRFKVCLCLGVDVGGFSTNC